MTIPIRHRGGARWIRTLLIVIAVWSSRVALEAHNPDTSYFRIRVSAERLTSEFAFDLFTLLEVAALDANNDLEVSRDELRRQGPRLEAFIRDRVRLELDTAPATLGEAGELRFGGDLETVSARDYHRVLVYFTFEKPLREMPEELFVRFELFELLGPRHIVLAAIGPPEGKPDEIIFSQAEPGYRYRTGIQRSAGENVRKFIGLGMEHIFIGYDHILFLIALVVVSRWLELVKIVTAFTVAHSITLTLAAFEWIRLPPRLVEIGIALTIMYVALENIRAQRGGSRWLLTFGFGLIHGLGFANVLQDLGLPAKGLVRSLVSFNVGVELGQLVIILILLPVLLLLRNWRHGDRARKTVSVLIFICGLGWFTERAF